MRHILFFWVITILFCVRTHGTDSLFAADRPNILFIYADDIGYEALNSYGGLDFETPRLNQMSKEGIQFSRAYASPVCTPSRVSMHASLYVTRHGHLGVLPVHRGTDKKVDFQKMPTFAQLMRANGYLTSVTGKWQLATLEVHPSHLIDSGFDSWCIWQIWKDGQKTLRHWNPTFNEDGKVRSDIADRFGPDVLIEYAIKQMTDAKEQGKPFLIVHNELLPHDPIIDTPDDRRRKRKPSLGNMINYMDQLVGRLVDAVEELGIRENTYVVFMGDNGTHEEDFKNPHANRENEKPHTRHTSAGLVNGGKFKLGDAGTHVPLIVWGPPSVPRGKICNDLVDIVDIFPTFCELSGTDIPDSIAIDGRSIASQIHGKKGTPRNWVHHGISGKGVNVFDGEFRLFSKGNKLIDARSLPEESTVIQDTAETQAGRHRLKEILSSITKDGPRPPQPKIDHVAK